MPIPETILSNKSSSKDITDKIIVALKTIYDPEIPVNIYDLGLVYEVHVEKDFSVKTVMTLTSPNCPEIESLPEEIKNTIESIKEVTSATIDIVFEPEWSMECISEEAKLELGLV